MPMTNFERATRRLQAAGTRPWQPDHATCPTARWVRDADMPLEVQQSAARMDAIIAAFAIGMLIGFALKGVLA